MSLSRIAENMKAFRLRSGLKQSEIADLVGITDKNWSSYERGRTEPNLETIVKLADAFRITVDSLVKQDMNVIADTLVKNFLDVRLNKSNDVGEKTHESLSNMSVQRPSNRVEEPSEEYVVITNQESILRKKVEQVNELIERLNKVGSSLSKTAQEAANINVYINMVVDLKVQLKEKERLVNDLEAQLKACRQSRHKQLV